MLLSIIRLRAKLVMGQLQPEQKREQNDPNEAPFSPAFFSQRGLRSPCSKTKGQLHERHLNLSDT